MSVEENLRRTNFALIDCETIQDGQHQCIRKLSLLAKDGTTCLTMDFRPCRSYVDLDDKDCRSFRFCKRQIHHLEYYPLTYAPRCDEAVDVVAEFLYAHRIDLLLYKGGCIEKRLSLAIGVPSYNIESLGAPKVNSHNPEEELREHYNFLLTLNCI